MQTIKLDLKGRPYKKEKVYTYYGFHIHYNGGPGYMLPYYVYLNGSFHCADTLAGAKRIILECMDNVD